MLFKDYMKANRWNYGTLAKELNVNRITIANWDNRVTAPTVYQAKKLADLLGVKLDELLEEENKGEK
jgi:ribosome-binding protein aMBF1 (putative translation factor)